jgi:hypothetical protein
MARSARSLMITVARITTIRRRKGNQAIRRDASQLRSETNFQFYHVACC